MLQIRADAETGLQEHREVCHKVESEDPYSGVGQSFGTFGLPRGLLAGRGHIEWQLQGPVWHPLADVASNSGKNRACRCTCGLMVTKAQRRIDTEQFRPTFHPWELRLRRPIFFVSCWLL